MSRTLSANCGSPESLNVSDRCGCRPNAFQIRCTDAGESPTSRAIERIDQWVASTGDASSVRRTTSATRASSMLRGRPERGASDNPSTRSFRKRRRHLPTVCSCTPTSAATALFVRPSAQRRTMRQRSDNPRPTRRPRTRRSSHDRSSSLNTTVATGRPARRPIPRTPHKRQNHTHYHTNFRGGTFAISRI